MNTSRRQPGVNARPGRTSRSMVYPAYAQSGPESPISVPIPISSPGSGAFAGSAVCFEARKFRVLKRR